MGPSCWNKCSWEGRRMCGTDAQSTSTLIPPVIRPSFIPELKWKDINKHHEMPPGCPRHWAQMMALCVQNTIWTLTHISGNIWNIDEMNNCFVYHDDLWRITHACRKLEFNGIFFGSQAPDYIWNWQRRVPPQLHTHFYHKEKKVPKLGDQLLMKIHKTKGSAIKYNLSHPAITAEISTMSLSMK